MGTAKKPEGILVELEKIFCRYDEEFVLQEPKFPGTESKEVEILCIILLYQYCKNEENFEIPVKILCGIMVGHEIKSCIMTDMFKTMVDEYRINLREKKSFLSLKKMMTFNDTKKALNTAMSDGENYDISMEELKNILEQIESCQKNIKILETNEITYQNNMRAQSEETNLLWWMVREWCECYEKLYKDMNVVEAALVIPVELYDIVEFELYPYSIVQIIRKILSTTREFTDEKYSLYDMIKETRGELMENKIFNFDEKNINSKIQPILYALKMKEKTEKEEEWKVLFQISSGYEMTELKMTVVDFSLQLCRELELLGYLKNEG